MTPRRSPPWTRAAVVCPLVMFGVPAGVAAESGHAAADSRVRTVIYSTDEIYRLHGFVGYDLEIEFASDETFTGIGGGDLDALSYGSYGNTFAVKPRATNVRTNLTVLTNKRRYLFDYVVSRGLPDPAAEDVIYLLRFAYPPEAKAQASGTDQIEAALTAGAAQRKRNYDYWYCGPPSIKPVGASDDGVHTRLQFAARAELPAVFVRNDDGTESLLNFSIDQGDVVIHRVTRQLILRRGRLAGCVVNQAFDGGGERLSSGTLSPQVHRETQAPHP
jgi:type IV secretion system protein VirB9